MATKPKSIRTSQLVSPFGAGAVVELGGESFACMDISRWPESKCAVLPDNNLARLIGREIRSPPVKDQGGAAVPFARFPRALFCPNCRRLFNYTRTLDEANEFKSPVCRNKECNKVGLVPMRFVAACEKGHLQDIDWYWWTHRSSQPSVNGVCARKTAQLSFTVTAQGGGDFDSMFISCSCGEKRSFEGLTDKAGWMNCNGTQPWEGGRKPCDGANSPRAYPRGASNIYFPNQLSALDLETADATESLETHIGLKVWLGAHQQTKGLIQFSKANPAWRDAAKAFIEPLLKEACREFGVDMTAAMVALEECIEGVEDDMPVGAQDQSQHGILIGEWPYLAHQTPTTTRNLRARPYVTAAVWPEKYVRVFEQVTLVDRLREVRALLGFSRVTTDSVIPADLNGSSNWLPGVESFGEGIFIKFNHAYLRRWEETLGVTYQARSEELALKCDRWGREPTHVYASPRFIALHTFAHGLIRRLSFDAGYSSSSLRERIYCDANNSQMAGILVYTSDSDAEGSLGGLVRQGETKRFLDTLARTIADLSWCSADPVCSEMPRQGVDGMNSAACHACALVSETSCMYNNSLLDRRLLVGDRSAGIAGLLGDLVGKAA